MEFGLMSIGDVLSHPLTGERQSEQERIMSITRMAEHAEDVGLDVYALGEHHNPPFIPSSPTTILGYVAAKTERITLSTSTTLITTNDPVKIAEDYPTPQHLADGRIEGAGMAESVSHETLELIGAETLPALRRELGTGAAVAA